MSRRGKSSQKFEQVRKLFLESVEALAESPDELVGALNIGLERVFEQLVHQACEDVGVDVDAFAAELDAKPELRDEIQGRLGELFSAEAMDRVRTDAARKEIERHLHVMRYVLSGIEPAGWVWDTMERDERRRMENFRAAGGEDDPVLLARVQRAIQKIDDKSYGRCESCESGISIDRLRLLPWSERCTVCQNALDSPPSTDQGLPRAHVTMFFEGGKRVAPAGK